MGPVEPTTSLTIGFVPSVTPGKWAGRWRERHPDVELKLVECDPGEQVSVLTDGKADVAFVRLPVPMDGLHVIPLYSERPVVVAAKDHFVALYEDEVPLADLDDETFLDVEGLGEAMAVEVAASGAGVAIMPMSLARLHHRRDAIHRPVSDTPETRIGVAWLSDNDSDLIQEFIGIVRGRTANSSRQPLAGSAANQKSAKDTGKSGRKPTSDPRRGGSGTSSSRKSRGPAGGKSQRPGSGRNGGRGRR